MTIQIVVVPDLGGAETVEVIELGLAASGEAKLNYLNGLGTTEIRNHYYLYCHISSFINPDPILTYAQRAQPLLKP